VHSAESANGPIIHSARRERNSRALEQSVGCGNSTENDTQLASGPESEQFPNVFRMGLCDTIRIRMVCREDVTRERKGSGEMPGYVSYLLRLWREKGGQTAQWRASLQDPHSGERVGFASLEDLFSFLRRETTGEAHGLRPEEKDVAISTQFF